MIKYIDEILLKGKRVLMRVDINVPLDDSLNITDDNRIRASLPSIRYALGKGAKLIVCSHLGKPKGKRVEKLSLKPAAKRLSELLGKDVLFAPDCIGEDVKKMAEGLSEGEVMLLENLRYHKGETENDPELSKELASLAEVYINDAFAVSHRAHASVVGVTEFMDVCAAGFLLKNEIHYFKKALENPQRPMVAVLGGSKVSSKLAAIENILPKVDRLIIGGAMANTFLLSEGYDMGKSLVEPDLVEKARGLMDQAQTTGKTIYLPKDFVVAEELKPDAETKTVPVEKIPSGYMALDIGPESKKIFGDAIKDAKTILWNGPLGAFEVDAFSKGTTSFAEKVGESSALSIAGGGDTGAAIKKAGQTDNISYISTGGGAFLELLEGKELPGIAALKECAS